MQCKRKAKKEEKESKIDKKVREGNTPRIRMFLNRKWWSRLIFKKRAEKQEIRGAGNEWKMRKRK